MNEGRRADFLARAIDDLISGLEPATPPGLDRRDVDAIMYVARGRLDAARASAHSGLQYEGAVWQQVLERIERSNVALAGLTESREAGSLLDNQEVSDLAEVADLRRQMSAQLIAFAEAHRADVWQRVQARISTKQANKRALFSFFRRDGQAYADLVAPALDSVAAGRPTEVGVESLDGVIRTAWTRKAASQVSSELAEPRRERVWSRIQSNVATAPAPRGSRWSRGLAAGATAAVVIAALGPIPATGFANHPAVEFVRFVGDHIGVSETASPPQPGSATTIDGSAASAREAAAALGIDVISPPAPTGFEATSSELFASGITSDSGVFVASFTGPASRTLTVYQERVSGVDLSAATGTAQDIALADGTPATYFDGSWTASDGSFTWLFGGTQTIVFDKAHVRTIVVHSGPGNHEFLAAFASTVAAAH